MAAALDVKKRLEEALSAGTVQGDALGFADVLHLMAQECISFLGGPQTPLVVGRVDAAGPSAELLAKVPNVDVTAEDLLQAFAGESW